MGRGHEARKTTGKSTDDSSQKVLGCFNMTSDTVLRAELGMYPLETSRRDMKKLKYKVRNMPRKSLPAIADIIGLCGRR